jgi:hypothetical protein
MMWFKKLRLTHWSTYAAFALWGSSAFTAQPTIASFVVHFGVCPVLLILVIFFAHNEGKRKRVSVQ